MLQDYGQQFHDNGESRASPWVLQSHLCLRLGLPSPQGAGPEMHAVREPGSTGTSPLHIPSKCCHPQSGPGNLEFQTPLNNLTELFLMEKLSRGEEEE